MVIEKVWLRGKVKTVSGCRKKCLTISQDILKQNCMAWSKAHAGRNGHFWHGTHQYSKHRVKTAFKDQWGNHFKAERDLGSSVEYLHSIDFGALNSISECRRASSSSKTLSSPTLCFNLRYLSCLQSYWAVLWKWCSCGSLVSYSWSSCPYP